MVGKYFALTWLNIAILIAATEIGIFGGFVAFLRAVFETVIKGSVADSFATFAYWFAIVLTGLLVSSLGGILIGAINTLVAAIITPILQSLANLNLEGIVAIAEGGFTIFVVWMLVKPRSKEGGKVGNAARKYTKGMVGSGSVVESILGFPLEQAKNAHARMLVMFPNDRTDAYEGNSRGYYSDNLGRLENPFLNDRQNANQDGASGEDSNPDKNQDSSKQNTSDTEKVDNNQTNNIGNNDSGNGQGVIQGQVIGTGDKSAMDTIRQQKQIERADRVISRERSRRKQ